MEANRDRVTGGGHEGLQDSDDTSALLNILVELSLEEIEQVERQRKGKSRDDHLYDDEELAFQLFQEELLALDAFSHDLALARELDSQLNGDIRLHEAFARQEEMDRRDREFAMALEDGLYESLQDTFQHTAESTHRSNGPAAASTSAKPTSSGRAHRTRDHAAPSSSAAAATAKAEPDTCVICMDPIEGSIVYAPCGHRYDVACFVDLIRAAVVDETLFPPACCRQPFAMEELRVYLDSKLQKEFDKKAIEFGTKNRVYCHDPTCSTFLGAATHRASRLMCTTCWKYTCGHCKGAAHSSSIPCTSTEDATVLAMAEQEGWKQCPSCGHLVELSSGCHHMTCRCRHEFCYLCTAPWKTCSCEQWDDDRLFEAAENRVVQQRLHDPPPEEAVDEVDYHQRIWQEAERLRFDHHCPHVWCYVFGPNFCENCGQFSHPFWHCPMCQLHLCARCGSNRWL
ncbi:hypothetical protein BV20DRAFT_961512 [Pilatotrama ljubarskyi]|nr:hypothetical protein BV20DRAFT_961512 [Pilatotrama ljubarskyi]